MLKYTKPRKTWQYGAEHQMGRYIYEGKHIAKYNLDVCKTCYEGNWSGWVLHYKAKLIAHLKEKGLPIPEHNEKGWLPRG